MGKLRDWLLGKPAPRKTAPPKGRAAPAPVSRAELEERARAQIGTPPPGGLPRRHKGQAGANLDDAVAREVLKSWLHQEDREATPRPPGGGGGSGKGGPRRG